MTTHIVCASFAMTYINGLNHIVEFCVAVSFCYSSGPEDGLATELQTLVLFSVVPIQQLLCVAVSRLLLVAWPLLLLSLLSAQPLLRPLVPLPLLLRPFFLPLPSVSLLPLELAFSWPPLPPLSVSLLPPLQPFCV